MEKKLNWTTTVVGSFPYTNNLDNMETAFTDQIDAGIEHPCYPQLIGMVEQFLDPLVQMNVGLVRQDKLYAIEEDLEIPNKAFALEYGEFVQNYFNKFPDQKSKVQGWKACLTGPFTLAGDITIPESMAEGKKPLIYEEPRAIMNADLVSKLAKIMAMIATEYVKMGATIVSMDEPTLGLIVGRRKPLFHSAETIVEILNKAIQPITCASSIHVCGRVSPKLVDILLNSDVDVMDHEFVNGDNEGVFTREMFDDSKKVLAYGVVQSSVPYQKDGTLESYVETPEIMAQRIKSAVDTFGKENLILKPDCGFGGLRASFGQEMASEMVRRKLRLLSNEKSRI